MPNDSSNPWTTAVARHASSASAFTTTAKAVDSTLWEVPVAEGKWSPAQITEHLNRTYQVILRELRGEKGIRIRSPWLIRQILRQTILRSIYRNRKLPRGARAPSEIMPTTVDGDQKQLLERFTNLAREFEAEALANQGKAQRKLTHHVFGEIDLLSGIDFIAIHIEHHHRQVKGES